MGIFEDVEALKTQMATAQENIATLQDDVSTLQNGLSSAQEIITALQTATTDSGWLNLTLNTGWSMNDYTSEVPQYRKIGKVVMLRGLVNATAAADRIIATLPEGYRPASGWYNRYNSVLNQSEYANVQVNANGEIMDYTKTTSVGRGYLSLNNIVFMTA